jgi:antitoxin component of RelBE/YafQ-DinJ toxin-antitoxin module
MSKKLTLRLDEEAIERAKQYAARRGTSVSKLVQRFFERLDEDETQKDSPSVEDSELVASLRGLLADAGEHVDEDDYYDHLWEKHA